MARIETRDHLTVSSNFSNSGVRYEFLAAKKDGVANAFYMRKGINPLPQSFVLFKARPSANKQGATTRYCTRKVSRENALAQGYRPPSAAFDNSMMSYPRALIEITCCITSVFCAISKCKGREMHDLHVSLGPSWIVRAVECEVRSSSPYPSKQKN